MMLGISTAARLAIAKGIERGDCVIEMEAIGLPQRTVNALEESKFKIVRLEELVKCQIFQLREIKNVGEKAVDQIIDCLARYDELENILSHELTV